jgi:hypothetical protein
VDGDDEPDGLLLHHVTLFCVKERKGGVWAEVGRMEEEMWGETTETAILGTERLGPVRVRSGQGPGEEGGARNTHYAKH